MIRCLVHVMETTFGFYFVFITVFIKKCYDLWFRLMLEQNLHEIEIKNWIELCNNQYKIEQIWNIVINSQNQR
jgi:hypothetical protein